MVSSIMSLFPEKEIDFICSDEKSSALYVYVKMVQHAAQYNGDFSYFGEPFTVSNLNSILHNAGRRYRVEETLSQTLETLKRAGLIAIDSNGHISLPKVDAYIQQTQKVKPVVETTTIVEKTPPKGGSPIYTEDELMAIKESRALSKDQYLVYFKRMRQLGQRDATKENEEEFWQYLVAADFKKVNGDVITKLNLPSTFVAWANRKRNLAAEDRKKEDDRKAQEAKEEEERLKKERWNDKMLRMEKEMNWDDE